jgi:hypothetical protein
MPAAMKVTQEPDFGPRPVREHGSLILACIVYWQAREISRVLCATSSLGSPVIIVQVRSHSPDSGWEGLP